ncbi:MULTISPECIES: 1-deoxy-D-xylulose-5-phosphate synthase [Prosthecochloris]|uniref:1-deoxy-D-xylulose-5-phosphate synthase n=1 Tax=Prosthecochloris marina TaxID=2017681 RepID=A0A317T7V2_9CHLB|nr:MULTISPECIES: 1-deoxy-D-xylulose-5-phosphate synthase [Prosthecochloris]PWW81491.1 1-deoxy-D-xylulose-5-phosphate synthase [Prosthecochloris marina]UZJ38236.1 1-deoxy-D-xylulose-5-phosphate synthase [Prosthecochloris sp. SCSIO W1103]
MENLPPATVNGKYSFLSKIHSPEDLKKFKPEELQKIADECRTYLIDVIAENGGHFGSSLGVVEMTVALHYVYKTPYDKIIWDVGHQAYIHKILTGRKDLMHTNRKFNGIAGFPKISESPHDAFGTGHASTSISAAAGLAAARDLSGSSEKIIAVIGDGSMTGGMAFEAMNHLGDTKSDVLVVLNDNQMAIAPSTGGLKNYLVNISFNKTYNKVRKFIWDSISLLNNDLGETAKHAVHKIEDGIKAALTPGAFFEALGFRYFGPIDGHDTDKLVKAFKEMQELPHPKLLHVITTKGKGFKPAEDNQSKWHASSGGFDTITGKSLKKVTKTSPLKYQDIFGRTLTELASKDHRIVGITAAMPGGTSLDTFQVAHPKRFYDVGIAEQHAVTFAAGMAAKGFKPFCAIYSTFLQRAYDQLIHDVALQKLPVVFAIDRAGLVGEDGPTHHGSFDLSYLHPVPNMIVMAPKDEQELRDMIYTASQYNDGPVAIRYPRGTCNGLKLNPYFSSLEIGKSEIVREGSSIAILAIGTMVEKSLEASHLLEQENIDALVVNMRFLKPLDVAMVHAIAESHEKIVVVEENSVIGGLGSAVNDYLRKEGLSNETLTLGLPDKFVTHGNMKDLYRMLGLDPENICRHIKSFYKGAVAGKNESSQSTIRTDRFA